MSRLICLAIAILALFSLGLSSAAAVEGRDRIVLRGNAFPAIIERETRDGIEYRITPSQTTVQTRRWSEVVEIIYSGMDGGNYLAGTQAMNAGRYEEAAIRFNDLATSASREWEGAYGYYRQGEAWEQAGGYQQAADAFGSLAAAYPEHRFWTDALYRQGINLARTQNPEAQGVIDALLNFRVGNPAVGRGPEFRANAIKAVMVAQAGKVSDARRLANSVALTPRDGDTWFHWGSFWASFLYDQGEFRDAAQQYQRMLSQVDDNPAQRAQLSLGLGVSLAQGGGDKASALMELLKLDTLPYGSSAQRCEAQYWAGRLLVEEGQANRDNEDDRIASFAKVQYERGMVLLAAAAGSISDHPSKLQAQRLVEELTPKEEEAEAAPVEAVLVEEE